MTTVTTVTANAAAAEDLTDDQYREIYDELRGKTSLRQFADLVLGGAGRSFAWWSKYERGAIALDRTARNQLRAAVGLPALPPTVAEATANVHPDAAVYLVGDQQPARRVILLAAPEPITITVNGSLHIVSDPPQTAHVTPVTAPKRRLTPRCYISIPAAHFARLNAARRASGLTWEQFTAPLIGDQHAD